MAGKGRHRPRFADALQAAWIAVCLLAALQAGRGRLAHAAEGFQEALDWGGHLRLQGSVSDPEAGSRLSSFSGDRLHDAAFELRSTHTLRKEAVWRLELHYEMIGSAGETRRANARFRDRYPGAANWLPAEGVSDRRRLMDLTSGITSRSDCRLYHRLDRLSLSAGGPSGSVSIGRQAVTWGNGFLFNPMDLFNPFSPTDVERDYKIGDDMLLVQAPAGAAAELQFLCVPRRNPATGDLARDHSSAAVKLHTFPGSLEMDAMAGVHYDDLVFGVGCSGYLGAAAWRVDGTCTVLDESGKQNSYGSICANLDYSWVAWGKNMYGWVEAYYTGLGTSDAETAWRDRAIMERLERGERYTIGRAYFDASLRVEFHPLVNGRFTLIANIGDPSGVLQPRLVWDLRQNLQATAGANLYIGGPGTEFGGIDLPGLPFSEAPADNLYLWIRFFY
jgi:hypothetical protein